MNNFSVSKNRIFVLSRHFLAFKIYFTTSCNFRKFSNIVFRIFKAQINFKICLLIQAIGFSYQNKPSDILGYKRKILKTFQL